MSFVLLNNGWAIQCDYCGSQTKMTYESKMLADMAILAHGGSSGAPDDAEEYPGDTEHKCPSCVKAERSEP